MEKRKKIGVIVQARLSSVRLPNKVLLPLAGKPVLWHIFNRLSYCQKVDLIILATSTKKEDKQLKKIADLFTIPTFFGSLNDVLARYYQAAKKFRLNTIVRITGDCPLIDPEIVDEIIDKFYQKEYDYYGLSGSFPDGLDVTVYSFNALEKAYQEAKLPSDREHVGGTFFKQNKNRFKTGGYVKFKNMDHCRWTLDESKDYQFLKIIFANLYQENKIFLTKDILKLLKKNPQLKKINEHIIRNEGYLKSLIEDRKFFKRRKR